LHPTTGPTGARSFDPAEVDALASALGVVQHQDRASARSEPQKPGDALAPGELAGRVFERLEQRQSLAEIVIALRVAPEVVRALYREWLAGLTEGEIDRQSVPALPAGESRRQRERFVTPAAFARLLAELPLGTRTRISIARNLGDDDMAENGGEIRRVVELAGFVVVGPIDPGEIARRYGPGDYRVTSYGFEPPGVRWEVFATLAREAEPAALAALAAVELPAPSVRAALPAPVELRGDVGAAAEWDADRAELGADVGAVAEWDADRAELQADAGAVAELLRAELPAVAELPAERTAPRKQPPAATRPGARARFGGLSAQLAAKALPSSPSLSPSLSPSSSSPSPSPSSMLDELAGHPALAPDTADMDPALCAVANRLRDGLRALRPALLSSSADLTARTSAAVAAPLLDPDLQRAALADVLSCLEPPELAVIDQLGEETGRIRSSLVVLIDGLPLARAVACARGYLGLALLATLAHLKGIPRVGSAPA